MSNAASLFVIAAPSGAGKTTLVKALVERNPSLKFSISYTTRQQRTTEEHGRDYFFVSPAKFETLREKGELLESALVFDNLYGTSRSQVEEHLAEGDHVVLEIDWQGAQQVRTSMPDCTTIFILPPSVEVLQKRLSNRAQDSAEVIARRMREARAEISHWAEFDYLVVNEDFDTALGDIRAIMRSRQLLRIRQQKTYATLLAELMDNG